MTNPKSPQQLSKSIYKYLDNPSNFRKKDTISKMMPEVEELYKIYLNKPYETKKIIKNNLPNMIIYFEKYTNNNNNPYKDTDFITGAIIYSFSRKYML